MYGAAELLEEMWERAPRSDVVHAPRPISASLRSDDVCVLFKFFLYTHMLAFMLRGRVSTYFGFEPCYCELSSSLVGSFFVCNLCTQCSNNR